VIPGPHARHFRIFYGFANPGVMIGAALARPALRAGLASRKIKFKKRFY
jgi:hypothetical protein